jgi:hypothetical protein
MKNNGGYGGTFIKRIIRKLLLLIAFLIDRK